MSASTKEEALEHFVPRPCAACEDATDYHEKPCHCFDCDRIMMVWEAGRSAEREDVVKWLTEQVEQHLGAGKTADFASWKLVANLISNIANETHLK